MPLVIVRMALETKRNHRNERSQAHRDSVWGAWHTQLHTERGMVVRKGREFNAQTMVSVKSANQAYSWVFVAELGCKSTGVPTVLVYHGCQFSGIWGQLKDIFLSVCEGISREG